MWHGAGKQNDYALNFCVFVIKVLILNINIHASRFMAFSLFIALPRYAVLAENRCVYENS